MLSRFQLFSENVTRKIKMLRNQTESGKVRVPHSFFNQMQLLVLSFIGDDASLEIQVKDIFLRFNVFLQVNTYYNPVCVLNYD